MGKFSTKEKYFKFVLYIAVIVLINIVGLTLFSRTDLTKNKMYSLSKASRDVVRTLSEPLTIKVFFSRNLPAPHNNTARYLRDLLEEYSAWGGKYFNYTFYNVSPTEDSLAGNADANREMANDYGIQPVQIRVVENDEIKFQKAYMGLVIIHGDLIEKIQAITSTDGLEYRLTTAIQKLNNKVSALLRIKDKIRVTMYLSSSLNKIAPLIGLDQLPALAGKVTDMVKKLNAKTLGVLEFKKIDVSDREKINALGKKYNLMALSWPEIAEKNIAPGSGTAGIVIEFKGKTASLPLISAVNLPIIGTTYQMADTADLEEQLNLIVEKMIGINKDIGFLTGHGTCRLTPDRLAMMQGKPSNAMNVFNSLISERYSIKPVDLKNSSIPDGLNCLVIARPTEKFTDYELFQIDQALMRGTNIAFISDSFKETAPQTGPMAIPPKYEPIDTGLEKLLAHYGIKIKKAYVLDKQCYSHQLPKSMGGGSQKIYFAPMLKAKTINNKPVYMKNIKGLVAMQISPVELVKKNIDPAKVTATRLLSSSDKSWLMEKPVSLNPMFISPPLQKDKFRSYDLAYMLSGTFTSYFRGKPIPEKESGKKDIKDDKNSAVTAQLKNVKTKHNFLETSKPVRLFVLPCSQMLQDNMLDAEGRSTNATFILNVIDHLNGNDSIAVLRSKQQTLNPVVPTTPFTRGVIKSFNIIGLPVLVILFGLFVFARRTARKKKITNRFKA